MSDSSPAKASAANASVETIAHPDGVTVDIVGIEAGNRGWSCEEIQACPDTCGWQ
jgi:hypothetical protein